MVDYTAVSNPPSGFPGLPAYVGDIGGGGGGGSGGTVAGGMGISLWRDESETIYVRRDFNSPIDGTPQVVWTTALGGIVSTPVDPTPHDDDNLQRIFNRLIASPSTASAQDDQKTLLTAIKAALEDSDDIVPITNPPPLDAGTVTIANGASLSTAGVLVDGKMTGVRISVAWTAAGLEFQSSMDNATWVDVYNGATKYNISGVVAGAYHAVDPNVFFGIKYVKVRSATEGTPVVQGADRILTVRKAG